MSDEMHEKADKAAFETVVRSVLSLILRKMAEDKGGDEWVMTALAPMFDVADAMQNEDGFSALIAECLREHLGKIEQAALANADPF